MLSWLSDPNFQWVLMGTIILGITSGIIGCFAVLKKQSLISDAVAHAALPGVCVAFILVQEKLLIYLLIGAVVAGLLSTYLIQVIVEQSKIKEDASIGIVLSVFFGFGVVLLTYIANNVGGNQSGLNEFVFGQAASLTMSDVWTIVVVSIVLLIITTLFYKEFKLIIFDPKFAVSIGFSYKIINYLLMFLIVATIVIGIQTVGVVLMTAMMIIPPVAARFWTERLFTMLILAGMFGGISSMIGVFLSTLAFRIPTGPVIVLVEAVIFILSFLFAPKQGLISKAVLQWKLRRKQSKVINQVKEVKVVSK